MSNNEITAVNTSSNAITIMLSHRNQVQNDIAKCNANLKEQHFSFKTMSKEDINQQIELKNRLIFSQKYLNTAENLKAKFSVALEELDNISETTNRINEILVSTVNLNDDSRAYLNTEINNVLQNINQSLHAPYENGYLFGSSTNNKIVTSKDSRATFLNHSSQVRISTSMTINPDIDPNDPAITGIVKVLKDIQTQVNDTTVTTISSALRAEFVNNQARLGNLLVGVSERRDTVADYSKRNTEEIKHANLELDAIVQVDPVRNATYLFNLEKDLKSIQSMIDLHIKQSDLLFSSR